jgi:hypothetical protein
LGEGQPQPGATTTSDPDAGFPSDGGITADPTGAGNGGSAGAAVRSDDPRNQPSRTAEGGAGGPASLLTPDWTP